MLMAGGPMRWRIMIFLLCVQVMAICTLMITIFQRNSARNLVLYTEGYPTMGSTEAISISSARSLYKSTTPSIASHETHPSVTTPSVTSHETTSQPTIQRPASRNPVPDPVTGNINTRTLRSLYESEMIVSHGIKLEWIRNRMKAMEKTWEWAAKNLSSTKPFLFQNPKSILLIPGLLVDKLCAKCYFAENANKGGPLGELVQWTDLMASLHLLGHQITVVTTVEKLLVVSRATNFDVVMCDYFGLRGLQKVRLFPAVKCKVRVLDSFGTEPLAIFSVTGKYKPPETNRIFTLWKLQSTKQFWTLYPHTPDNSFLGFAMEMPEKVHTGEKGNQSLIYGKRVEYIKNMEPYLKVVGTRLELHSTFGDLKESPADLSIINHGIVDHVELSGLLQKSKLFIGLGFPYEGPGSLEAVANGCPVIQPSYSPPRGRLSEKFFKSKPTTRMLNSQNPYLEQFVGEPYVYTVDASDLSAVKEVVDKVISRGDLPPYIPYEFTQQGMMERIGAYMLFQDFCKGTHNLNKQATASASSYHADHPAGQAIDDDPKGETCYQSEVSSQSWWEADLGSDQFIRDIVVFFKELEENDLLLVSVKDTHGNNVNETLKADKSLKSSWEAVNTLARYVRVETVSLKRAKRLTLCRVNIFGPQVWPKPHLLQTLVSDAGESCSDSCTRHNMTCEYNFFPLINNKMAFKQNSINCTEYHDVEMYKDMFPSYVQSGDNGFVAGSCVTTKINELLSCSGRHTSYLRLCPCRHYRKGQVALPVEL